MEEATSEVHILRLALLDAAIPACKPGQYLEALLPGNERVPLSIANCPSESTPWVELHVHRGPERRRASLFLDQLRSGGTVAVEMPKGDVWVETPLAAPLLLLASGTGIAQSKAVIEAALSAGCGQRLSLIWASRNAEGFYLRDNLEAWSLSDPAFEFTLVTLEECGTQEIYGMAKAELDRIRGRDVLVSGSPAFAAGCSGYFETLAESHLRIRSDTLPQHGEPQSQPKTAVAV